MVKSRTETEMTARELLTVWSQRAHRTVDQPISYLMSKAVANPHLISLAAGFVDAETLPVEEVRQLANEILNDPVRARAALQYGTTEGLTSLRERIVNRIRQADKLPLGHPGYSVEQTITSTGSQQLLCIIAEILLDPGDFAVVGHPSYLGFMGPLRTAGATCVPIPMDSEGMRPDVLGEELENLARKGSLERVKLVYLQSFCQNPTGTTISDRRRDELMSVIRRCSRKNRIYVVEDSAYRDLLYDGPDIPSIKSRDLDGETVCYLGTFSKPFSPGLRTGFGIFPKVLVNRVLQFKGNHDFGSGNFNQHLLERAMASGLLDKHIRHLRDVYRLKRDTMLAAMDDYMPETCSWNRPAGGLYVYLTLPEAIETGPESELFRIALEKGVLYVPGEFCYAEFGTRPMRRNEMRLSFGVVAPEQLREGTKRLADAILEAGGK